MQINRNLLSRYVVSFLKVERECVKRHLVIRKRALYRINQINLYNGTLFFGNIQINIYFLNQHQPVERAFLLATTRPPPRHPQLPSLPRGHSDVARALLQNGATEVELDEDGNRPGFFLLSWFMYRDYIGLYPYIL